MPISSSNEWYAILASSNMIDNKGKFSVFKILIATIASALAMFMLAGLWNLVVFPNLGITFAPGLLREVPIFPLIILGYLIISFTMVYIGLRSNFAANYHIDWVIVGILVMEIAFGFSSLVLQANYNFPLSAIPLDLLWYLCEGAAGGYIASLILKK